MNNSKLYNMAAKIAVDKLVPKPIHIAISMQGGGGLSNIELPVIKRVSGGDIGDTGEFIGGYTDADAGVEATVSDTFYGNPGTDNGTDIVSSAGLKLVPNKSWSRRNLPEKIKERLNPGRDFTNTDGRYYFNDPTKELDRLREGGGAEFGLAKGIPEGFGMPPNISEEEFMRGVRHTQEHFEKPFYRTEKGKRMRPDFETENRILEKLKRGHGDFLTPKEKEVLDVMNETINEGEETSYNPIYQSKTYPPGKRSPFPIVPEPGVRSNLKQTPALPGENVIGYGLFEDRIKEEINVKASNQSTQITKQIADISNSMIQGEWPKEKGDMMIKQLQQNLKRVDSHRNQQLNELKDNIHAEKYGKPGSERAARLYENYVFESDPGLYPSEKYGTNYYRPKLASGGGISSLNDSININGQPHRLVWANPQEERVLKDMGGSGKPGPGGMPSYQWGDYPTDAQYDEAAAIEDNVESGNTQDWTASEEGTLFGGEFGGMTPDQYKKYERDIGEGVNYMESLYPHHAVTYTAADIKPLSYLDSSSSEPYSSVPKGRRVTGLPWLADKNVPAARQSYNLVGDLPRKGFLGLMGDPMNMSEAIEGAYKSGFAKWRAGIGMYETDAPKAYNEWFAKQNPEDLVKGYKIGDPVGYSTRSSMNRITKQLKNKFQKAMAESEEDVALSGGWETDELSRKELQDAAKGIEGIEDFTPYDGTPPIWMPAWMQAVVGFFSRTVIGYGKVGGVPVHIHEDGTVTAISPEDSPGYQHETGSVADVPRRYRSKPDEQASISETVTEKEPSALERLLSSRPEPSSLAQLDEDMKKRLIKDFYSGKNIFSEFG